jgi:hypothetical protein
MQDIAIPKKMLYEKLYATRRRERPRMRWLDDVSLYLRRIQQLEGQSMESRSLEAYCRGGQGPPRAVELFVRKKGRKCSSYSVQRLKTINNIKNCKKHEQAHHTV